ncbi:hypothetical protein BMS3Abin08_01740 [bacterium BMS3Abin08]|nr:hypothetical protein BMS3Abin08_01740 [bacterium BMS3Abin08]
MRKFYTFKTFQVICDTAEEFEYNPASVSGEYFFYGWYDNPKVMLMSRGTYKGNG